MERQGKMAIDYQSRLQAEELSLWIQSYKWHSFLTVTCKYPRKDSIALMRDIWDLLSERSNQFWWCPDGLYLPVRAFIACEPHKFSNNLHAHAIIAGGEKYRIPINRALNSRFGRSRVELCRSMGDVAGYCSKYVTKWGDGDNYNYFGSW